MPDLLFAGIMNEARTGSPRHSHHCWEMVRYVEGSGVLTVGGRRIPFAPGTIMALPPEVPHEEDAPGGYRCYFVGFKGPKPRGEIPVCQDDEHGSFATACSLL
ncbi:MAG: cupin domain-containing protein, partial [Mycobacterium sp.]